MQRVPEPELMDDPEQARAYAEADFTEANDLFVRLFRELVGGGSLTGQVVDLGCGPADIPLRLARVYPDLRFVLVDGSQAMLAHAQAIWARAGLLGRAQMLQASLPPRDPLPASPYDAVISNSLIHHLRSPDPLWALLRSCGKPAAPVLVMDLRRPESRAEQEALVETYAADAPSVLRRDFRNSLAAAFTLEEIRQQLENAGLAHLAVRAVSNRHLAVSGRL